MLPAFEHTQLPPNCHVLTTPNKDTQAPDSLFTDLPEVLTAQEAAKALSICDKQVRELARQGKLIGFRVGKSHRFTKQSLIDFVQKGGTNG